MCECRDRACAERVQEWMLAWSTEMAKNRTNHAPAQLSPAELTMLDKIASQYAECMTNALLAGKAAPLP